MTPKTGTANWRVRPDVRYALLYGFSGSGSSPRYAYIMAYQQLTPPTMFEDELDLQCLDRSASTIESCFPQDWSPESLMTAATTPPKSPARMRERGPALLPKVRLQDQLITRTANPAYHGHSRTTSLPVNGNSTPMQGQRVYRPGFDRRSTSPPGGLYQASPISAPSPYDHIVNDQTSLTRPSMSNMRSASTSNIRSHSRNSSTASIDASMLCRFGYPTYRQSPTPVPITHGLPMSRAPSAMSHLAPITMPGGHMQSYPQRRRTASPPAVSSRLAHELSCEPTLDFATTTALGYLTAPNPELALTQRTLDAPRGSIPHFWFDIRNVRPWDDFNVATIAAIPELWQLLQTPVGKTMLPEPGKVNTNPENPAQLIEACAMHHAVKVNAALKLAQGAQKHMAMRGLNGSPAASRNQPEFVASYQSDTEKTIYGDGRGRVVGVVKSWEQWNSGMRTGRPAEQMRYLLGLAQVQRFMREHGTRYGFLMTEIEVVCVRAGGPPSWMEGEEGVEGPPLFGFVEVAAPVRIATSSTTASADGSTLPPMTAALALWWLHLLARDSPFPQQYHWRLCVGGPAELSRQHVLGERDSWMPKLIQHERREAKRVRGWVLPGDALSKKEGVVAGKGRRGGK
ncbi:hypothetical protein LTR12_007352 [Friedmanniomyces endolithicus]|nr:hypothetical protein LTR12_007352 [Friedmanniomyces endolithicus]